MGLLLYHPASVGSVRVDFRAPWTSNRMELLRDYLLGFYPSEHPCFAVLSQSEPSATPRISRGQLAHLAEDVASYAYGTSMYVPPVEAFSFDEALVRQMLKVESQSRRLASGDVPL